MNSGSLKRRLLVSAAGSLLLALSLAGLGLSWLFERHVERRVVAELANHMDQLIGAMQFADDGKVTIERRPPDLRFSRLLSGLYWQVDGLGDKPLRSRSLWDQVLVVTGPADRTGKRGRSIVKGPDQQPLFALYRNVTVKRGSQRHNIRVTVALNHSEITDAVAAFNFELAMSLVILGAVLIVASWLGVGLSIRPVETLREKLAAIRRGNSRRLEGSFPSEVAPLAEDLNSLLEAQQRSLTQARMRAANLAHGLKTPLTILGAVARDIANSPPVDAAKKINAQITTMQRHIEHELTRAKLAGGTPLLAMSPLLPVVKRITATMRRLPGGDQLEWRVLLSDSVPMAVDEHDLTEIVGNILDNARKWAGHFVIVRAETTGEIVTLIVEDDGPGLTLPVLDEHGDGERDGDAMACESDHSRRLKERQGSGVGLSIAREIAQGYGGGIELFNSPHGGLGVSVTLPRRGASPAAEPRNG